MRNGQRNTALPSTIPITVSSSPEQDLSGRSHNVFLFSCTPSQRLRARHRSTSSHQALTCFVMLVYIE
jgi:hypothetical protein